MSKRVTLSDLELRAKVAIDNSEDFVFALAANCGQDVENVGHMTWFRREVCIRLCQDYKKYSHLLEELTP